MRRISDRLQGSGSGAAIMAFMGGIWVAVGLYRLPLVQLACALLPAVLLIAWGVSVIRAGKHVRTGEAPLTEAEIAAESAMGKRFGWIFGGEGIAIFLAVNVLANIGKSKFLLPTIGVIVGLHFLPLARLYHYSLYYWTGALQILLCVVAAVAFRSEPNRLNTAVAIGMGLTVWITALTVLIQANRLQTNVRAKPLG